MTHPTENDLVNFARDELGARKKDRIIEHCKQCRECADLLIEATREHAPDPGPIKLSRFNKLSILFLIITLVAAIAGMMWFLSELGTRPDDLPGDYELPPPGQEMPLPGTEQQQDPGGEPVGVDGEPEDEPGSGEQQQEDEADPGSSEQQEGDEAESGDAEQQHGDIA